MNLDLSQVHRDEIEKILVKHIPNAEVWAFGSRVRGTSKNSSDLDLVIVSNNETPFRVLTMLRVDLTDSDIPFKVDVLDWQSISKEFQKIISREYVVFYDGNNNDKASRKIK